MADKRRDLYDQLAAAATLQEQVQAVHALYLDEFGPEGYGPADFLDFVVAACKLTRAPFASALAEFYEQRAIKLRALGAIDATPRRRKKALPP